MQLETMKAIDSFTKTLAKNKNNRFKGQNLDELLSFEEKIARGSVATGDSRFNK